MKAFALYLVRCCTVPKSYKLQDLRKLDNSRQGHWIRKLRGLERSWSVTRRRGKRRRIMIMYKRYVRICKLLFLLTFPFCFLGRKKKTTTNFTPHHAPPCPLSLHVHAHTDSIYISIYCFPPWRLNGLLYY